MTVPRERAADDHTATLHDSMSEVYDRDRACCSGSLRAPRLWPRAGYAAVGESERGAEVLRCIALGLTNAEIAERLYVSVRTVETHRAHIKQKLDVRSRAELVRFAAGTRVS